MAALASGPVRSARSPTFAGAGERGSAKLTEKILVGECDVAQNAQVRRVLSRVRRPRSGLERSFGARIRIPARVRLVVVVVVVVILVVLFVVVVGVLLAARARARMPVCSCNVVCQARRVDVDRVTVRARGYCCRHGGRDWLYLIARYPL
jgi:hypothetical protein